MLIIGKMFGKNYNEEKDECKVSIALQENFKKQVK